MYPLPLHSSSTPQCNHLHIVEVPYLCLASDSILALIAGSGRTSGIALDCGADCNAAVCCYDGHPLPYTARYTYPGGEALNDHLLLLLMKAKHATVSDIATLRDIKVHEREKSCTYKLLVQHISTHIYIHNIHTTHHIAPHTPHLTHSLQTYTHLRYSPHHLTHIYHMHITATKIKHTILCNLYEYCY